VLSNVSMPGLLKIGSTTRDPSKRTLELASVTGVPTPFKLEAYVSTPNPTRTEAAVHARMGSTRVNSRREFFRAGVDEALAAARSAAAAERLTVTTPGRGSVVAGFLDICLLLGLYNACLFAAGLDMSRAWRVGAANGALFLLTPPRLWDRAFAALAKHPAFGRSACAAAIACVLIGSRLAAD
jgi:hypothetical protein